MNIGGIWNFLKTENRVRMAVATFALLFLLLGCAPKQDYSDLDIELSDKQAQYFAGYTSEIKSNQAVILRFAKKIRYPVGSYVGVVKLQPELDCKIQVINEYEIRITPIRYFNRTSYQLVIDLSSLFKEDLEPLTLPLTIQSREIKTLLPNFVLNQDLRKFTVSFSFTENNITRKMFAKAITLKLDDKPLSFQIYKDKVEPATWVLESEDFVPGSYQAVNLHFAKDILLLDEDINRSFTLPDRMDLLLQTSYYETINEQYVLVLSFTDNLDFEQDISPFISIEGMDEINLSKQENRIHIEADFQTNQSYNVTAKKGIRSMQGLELKEDRTATIHLKNELANLLFSEQGNILTSMGNNAIGFRSVNVKQARLRVLKVYESNLGFFLHDRTISGNHRHYWNFNRVGTEVFNSVIEIDSELNRWVENEIDLSKLLQEDRTGLYVIELSYSNNDCIGENHNSGHLTKNIMISDLALSYKAGNDAVIVATDLTTNKQAANAEIRLYNFQNQLILSGKTNSQGMFFFSLDRNNTGFAYDFIEKANHVPFELHYIIAEHKDSKALLNPSEMQWNMSTFDIRGYDYPEKGSAFIYTERGVYRPGDVIHFTMVFRNKDNSFPANQPVNISIFDPTRTRLVTTTLTGGKDGVFSYRFESDVQSKTGTWQLHYKTGGINGTTNFKIETVVAERLKVQIEPELTAMNFEQKDNKIKLNVMYLFGSAARDLSAKMTASYETQPKQFLEFPGFHFVNQTIDFNQPQQTILSGTTDAEGNLEQIWQRPDFSSAPCGIVAELQAEVIDKGGRASKATEYITIDPFSHYAGIKLSENMITFTEGSLEVLLVDAQGKPVVGEPMEIRVYQNNRYWWWEYNWQARNAQSYKQSRDSKLVFSKNMTSENAPMQINIGNIGSGKYLVEVSHKINQGHTASQFFYPRWWGETQGGIMDIGVMKLRSDKPEYFIHEKAIIQFDAPEGCRVLISLEHDDEVRNIWWEEPKVENGKATITLQVDETMIPNVYCTISVMQKVENSNDLPIRSYGTIPIKVLDKKTVNNITIQTVEAIKPNSTFSVEIQTQQKRKSQVTIAVVDEGLLSLTNFRTPNPWNHFFRKRLLKIKSYDTYGFVMGISKGDVFKSFSIGGDASSGYESAKTELDRRKEITDLLQKTVKRFEPVCLYSGVLETDDNGYLATNFDMPHYVGAVRIMAVSVAGNAYGAGEKTVPVKDKIMVQPTLPRFASPGDELFIPVEVFVDDESIKEVELTLQTEGPISISAAQKYILNFTEPGSQLITIPAEIMTEIGFAKLDFTVRAGEHKNEHFVNLPVYPSQPSTYQGETKILARGSEVSFLIPDNGYKGSMTADIQIAKLNKLNLSNRIDWLLRYPYGCLEQVTSAVFPQLFLKDLIVNENLSHSKIDKNINAGIKRMHEYQLPNGSLSYWPGNRNSTHWGTNYAVHFLLEAKKQGYYVSPDFINAVLNWLQRQTVATVPQNPYEYANQTYSLYLLALGERPHIQSMNILYESYLDKLPGIYQWLLAATYQMIGKEDIAKSIETQLTNLTYSGAEWNEYYRRSWGTQLRDEALLLIAYNVLDKKTEAFEMFNHIAETVSDNNWYSTQTLGFCLTALGGYYRKNVKEFASGSVTGSLLFTDGTQQHFDSEKLLFNLPLSNQFGEEVKIRLNSNSKQENVFVTMNWTGIPVIDFLPKEFNGLSLRLEFRNDAKQRINPEKLAQGEVMQMSIVVKNLSERRLENLALVQYLPAGWEIENERLHQTFSQNQNQQEYDYLDIRDDKIMWFFDLPTRLMEKTFHFKIRAVTRGSFKLPSTYCEAMYHHTINATLNGRNVTVIEPN